MAIHSRHTLCAALILCLTDGCGAQPSDRELPGALLWVRNFPDTDAKLLRVEVGADDSITLAFLNRGVAQLCDQRFGSSSTTSLLVVRLPSDALCPASWVRVFRGDWESALLPSLWDSGRLGLAVAEDGDLFFSAGGLIGNFDIDGTLFNFAESDGLIAALNGSDGSLGWVRNMRQLDRRLEPRDLATGSDGMLYVVASSADPPFGVWVAQLNQQDGLPRWRRFFEKSTDESIGLTASRIAVRADTLVISGQYIGEVEFGGGNPAFIDGLRPSLATMLGETPARFAIVMDASNGSSIWGRSFNDGHPGEVQVAVDSRQGIILVGNLFSSEIGLLPVNAGEATFIETSTMTVLRMDSKGETEWHRSWSGQGGQFGSHLSLDQDDNILTGGTFSAFWEFGTRPLFASERALYVAKIESNGREVWARFTDRTGPVTAGDVAATSDGKVLASGVFEPGAVGDSRPLDELPTQIFLMMLDR